MSATPLGPITPHMTTDPTYTAKIDSVAGAIQHTLTRETLRDYFAGQALVGLLANPQTIQRACGLGAEEDVLACWSYEQADAMLAERERKP